MHPEIKTETQIRSITVPESGREDHSIYGVPGLRLRVTKSGTKTFRLESRRTGYVTLGTFPQLSLKEARHAALALIADAQREKVNRRATSGPVLSKKTRKTLQRVLDEYESDRGRLLSGWSGERDAIKYRYQDRMRLAADAISKDVVLAPVKRDKNIAAKRAAVYLSKVLRWAEVGDPPSQRTLDALVPETPRTRVLTHAEIRAVLKSDTLNETWRDFTRALFLSMQRRNDVGCMRRRDVDLEAGVWNAMIHKNRGGAVEVALPLSRQMSDLIERRCHATNNAYVFGTRNDRPLTTSFDKNLKRLQACSGTADWSWHDIRRTSRTLMSAAGVPPSVAERCMVHSQPEGRIAAIYDQHDWLGEMRDGFQALADKITEIENAGHS